MSDTDQPTPEEIAAYKEKQEKVRDLNSQASRQSAQLVQKGMLPQPASMAMARVNCLVDFMLGAVNLEEDFATPMDRLRFEEVWLSRLTASNRKAMLEAPGANGAPGGLFLPGQ